MGRSRSDRVNIQKQRRCGAAMLFYARPEREGARLRRHEALKVVPDEDFQLRCTIEERKRAKEGSIGGGRARCRAREWTAGGCEKMAMG